MLPAAPASSFRKGKNHMYILPGYINFHIEEGAIYVTSELYQNTVKLTDPSIQEAFRTIVQDGGCNDLSTDLSRFLHDQEMLVTEQELAQIVSKIYEAMNDSLIITMMPTEGCNFRCSYCYESHVPSSMTRNMLDHIHRYITEQAPNYKHINISWFGGEPTLCRDTVLETAELVQSLQKVHAFRYTSSMTTNGYLLNPEYFKEYYHAGITSFQITLDGWNHDQTRPHVSGKGTLQRILDNLTAISALPEEEYNYSIIIRHNVLPNDCDLSWYDHLNRLFGHDKRFSLLIRPVCDWGGESVKSLNLPGPKEPDTAVDAHVQYLKKIGMRCDNLEHHLLSNVCNAGYPHSMVFRADGKIEKCTICLDHSANQIGYIDWDKGVVLDNAAARRWYTTELKPECYRCVNMLSCLNVRCKRYQIVNGDNGDICPHRMIQNTI